VAVRARVDDPAVPPAFRVRDGARPPSHPRTTPSWGALTHPLLEPSFSQFHGAARSNSASAPGGCAPPLIASGRDALKANPLAFAPRLVSHPLEARTGQRRVAAADVANHNLNQLAELFVGEPIFARPRQLIQRSVVWARLLISTGEF
jgi:hypothetical protein